MDHDISEGILNFPFDHIYACHTENVDVSNDTILHNIENENSRNEIMQLTVKLNNTRRENCRLKDLVLVNLDLLQQQSDELILKDKEISQYLDEIEKLKLKLSKLGGSLNLHLQNINPPPLVHLTGQSGPTVTILPEPSSQVQYTNISGILNSNDLDPDKSIDRKPTLSELSCANVGSLIDTRYIQCTNNVFDTPSNICIQRTVQPIRATVQSAMPMSNLSGAQLSLKTLPKTNKTTYKSITSQINDSALSKSLSAVKQIDDVKPHKISDIIIKESDSPVKDNPISLTLNKRCKTIYTYEKSSKRNVKGVLKSTNPSPSFLSDVKLLKMRNQSKVHCSILADDKLDTEEFTIDTSGRLESVHRLKYNSFPSNEPSPKSDNEYISNDRFEKLTPVKIIKTEPKPTHTRKFFTSGHSLKEKGSCRDFSYGESLENIKYAVKPDILEYLEGNNSNSQPEMDVFETNLEDDKMDWKEDSCSMSNMSTHSVSPDRASPEVATSEPDTSIANTASSAEVFSIEKVMGIRKRLDGTIILPDDMLDKIIETSTTFPSYDEFISNVNKIFMDRYLEIQEEEQRRLAEEPQLQSNESHRNIQSKNCKKKNIRRKRALSSASKVSTVSQSDSTPYSWIFSGQDFKILESKFHMNYYIPPLGSTETYFSSMQLPKESIDEEVNLEVPSWRIKNYSPDEYIHTTENTDEDVYLKRHSKMEIEERRRKRWDFQMIREQRHIEKLKQRQERKNSGGSKQSRNSKVACSGGFGEEFPLSFYPSPEDVLALSLDDMVPISAFGECIPHLPSRYFQLPWIHSCPHNHSRSHSSAKKKAKHYKSEEE